MKTLATLLILSVFACVLATAQTEKIALWNGLAPGTGQRVKAETVDAKGNISQVYQPELIFYAAPKLTADGPAIIVCPGGGYTSIVMQKEGVRIAQWLNRHGLSAFVLKYRLEPSEAVQDLRRAMRVVRQRAASYRIDPAKIGALGFSAGGHLCANLAVSFAVSDVDDETDRISARPDFCAPIYGVVEPLNTANGSTRRPNDRLYKIASIKDAITANTPPMFIAHAVDDGTVPVEQSLNLFVALKAKGVPAELHLYEKGGHGFALEPESGYATSWGDAFILWLRVHGIEAPPAGKPPE